MNAADSTLAHWLPQPDDAWNEALLDMRARRRVGPEADAAALESARQQILAEETDVALKLMQELRKLRAEREQRTLRLG
jgi:hypothetical protein